MTEDLPKPLTRKQRRLLGAAAAIRTHRPETIDFLHTVQCQCGLPYRNPGDAVREWDRKQGFASLRIEAGSALDPATREYVKLGLPYGEKPRLVLIHLASEAIRTGSPVVDVEDSMTAFARSLGLDTNGPSLRHLKDQLARLAAATVRFGVVDGDRAVQINTQIVSALDLWYPAEPGQRVLWPSTVRLGTDYFQSLTRHAVPLDRRAVGALASSSMALDVYVWLAQRLHRVPPGRPQRVTWVNLGEQFGQGFERLRDFRRAFLGTLRQVLAVYPAARLEVGEEGVSLWASPPPVAGKTVSLPAPIASPSYPQEAGQERVTHVDLVAGVT
jgi:hypothetical protein